MLCRAVLRQVDCDVGRPKVNYRETIQRRAEFEYLHKKQSGGSGEAALKFPPPKNVCVWGGWVGMYCVFGREGVRRGMLLDKRERRGHRCRHRWWSLGAVVGRASL